MTKRRKLTSEQKTIIRTQVKKYRGRDLRGFVRFLVGVLTVDPSAPWEG